MEYLDNRIGELMALLKELNVDDNTIVIFTSDNGGTQVSFNTPLSFARPPSAIRYHYGRKRIDSDLYFTSLRYISSDVIRRGVYANLVATR